FAETPRGETPLDGLVLEAEPLYAARAHDALDAAGAVLGDGRILQLEGIAETDRPGDSGAGVERAASAMFALIDRGGTPGSACIRTTYTQRAARYRQTAGFPSPYHYSLNSRLPAHSGAAGTRRPGPVGQDPADLSRRGQAAVLVGDQTVAIGHSALTSDASFP